MKGNTSNAHFLLPIARTSLYLPPILFPPSPPPLSSHPLVHPLCLSLLALLSSFLLCCLPQPQPLSSLCSSASVSLHSSALLFCSYSSFIAFLFSLICYLSGFLPFLCFSFTSSPPFLCLSVSHALSFPYTPVYLSLRSPGFSTSRWSQGGFRY